MAMCLGMGKKLLAGTKLRQKTEFRHATALLLTSKDGIILQKFINTVCKTAPINPLGINFNGNIFHIETH